ncbi:glycosyltransferase [Acinetobacter sp. VNK23]|uniref:glycosyltransferase family 2 protein n=1 Tax=Acinetobacter thutiue TaxID=2998078 RepID=UPI0025769105|nr:glycosyltransferase [Acinetobacter thutiue]MDM1021930.1 glycosyltransferase [Acinetobacter thutiue]
MPSKSQPLVSVIIPCYNHARYVQDCIQSVIDQTYTNIELIIIDDGSKDNSIAKIQEMLSACKERFVRFEFRYRPNQGLSSTLNEALEWCKGDFVSPIASDDQMLSKKIELQIPYMLENEECVAIFGGINQIDDSNNIVRTLSKKARKYEFSSIAKLKYFLQAPTQLIRMKDLINIGGYNPEYRIEDWYSYLVLTQSGKYIYLMQDIVCNYRRHEDNNSKNMELMLEKITILNNIGLDKEQISKYNPYVLLSIASDLSVDYKKKAIIFWLKTLCSNPIILLDKKMWLISLKIMIPKKVLWRNR